MVDNAGLFVEKDRVSQGEVGERGSRCGIGSRKGKARVSGFF